MRKIQTILVCVALLWLATFAEAQRSSGLSSDLPDARTLSIQRKVDGLFDDGNYERAYFIYRNELVPLGDKYAQYMVGFMHVTGLGVTEDPVTASAWYRLAAERGTPEFVAVTKRLMRDFDATDRQRSDSIYYELRLQYSDLAVLLSSIKRDVKELQKRTGTRISGESGSVAVIDLRSGNVRSSSDHYGTIERQLEDRVKLLVEIGEFDDIDSKSRQVDIQELERLVKDRLQSQLD